MTTFRTPGATIAVARITGLILAGGRGSRMGSVDKGLQPLSGEPLVSHVLRRFAPQVASIVISANRHRDRYEALGHPVVADTLAGYLGPLAGLHAGLSVCRTEFLAVVPCDAPFVPHDLVGRLARAFDADDVRIAVCRTPERVHPVFCMMRTTVLADLGDYLAAEGRAVQRWIAGLKGREVSFDDERRFRNINTVADLDDAEQRPHRGR